MTEVVAILAETTDQSFDTLALQQRFGMPLTRLEDWARRRIPSLRRQS